MTRTISQVEKELAKFTLMAKENFHMDTMQEHLKTQRHVDHLVKELAELKGYTPRIKFGVDDKPNIEINIISEVDYGKDDYEYVEITTQRGWSSIIEKNILPIGFKINVGDTVIGYMRGSMYVGRQINDTLLNYETENARLDAHEKWRDETAERYAVEYAEFMEEIKDDELFVTCDVTGFGGSYEAIVQKMINAGTKWLDEHPTFDFKIDQSPHIAGIASIKDQKDEQYQILADEFEKAMIAPDKEYGISGMQHACALNHCKKIKELGREEWLLQLEKHHGSKSIYVYPMELPATSFNKPRDYFNESDVRNQIASSLKTLSRQLDRVEIGALNRKITALIMDTMTQHGAKINENR